MVGLYLGRVNTIPNVTPNSGFSAQSLGGEPDISGLNYSDKKNIEYNAYQAELDRKFNAQQAEISRKFNAEEAQKTREWQQEMSNSAYSRAVADLKSAGINPYALLSGMSSSSTPSGATGSGSSAYSNSHTGNYSSGSRISSQLISATGLAFAAAIRAGLVLG